jgi:hypothetical protein
MSEPIQAELPLEHATYDHYTIELRKGPVHDELTIRQHTAKSVEDAERLIEGLRDTYNARDGVSWQYEEVQADGNLYGMGKGGMVYLITVVPPLTTPLS